MFCVYCGYQVDDEAVFCSNCGKKLSDIKAELEEKNVRNDVEESSEISDETMFDAIVGELPESEQAELGDSIESIENESNIMESKEIEQDIMTILQSINSKLSFSNIVLVIFLVVYIIVTMYYFGGMGYY